MDAKITLETVYQIWNDKTGDRIELGPDRDGLGLMEIRSYASDGKVTQCVTFTNHELETLQTAINRYLNG